MLLENNQVGNRERKAQGELKAREPGIREAAQLVDLRFEGRVCMLPRQHLNLILYEASGRVVHNERNAREVTTPCPGDGIIARIDASGFYGQRFLAERWSVSARRWEQPRLSGFGLGKIKFPEAEGEKGALTGTAGRPLINKRRARRANLI